MASCNSFSLSGPVSHLDDSIDLDPIASPPCSRVLVNDFAWSPGDGVTNYPFGSEEECATRDRLHRTSLLFIELQQQVYDNLAWSASASTTLS